MDLPAAFGLSSSAGLNAYIPMLAYGLLARYTDFVNLPNGWTWLSDPIFLSVLAVLLVIELVADTIPAVDSVNDMIQTLIRPTSGGIMFASAFGPETVGDSSVFSNPETWVLLVVGVVIALVIHLMKSGTRPLVNAGTVGIGAPVVSTTENLMAASLTGLAIFAPVLVFVAFTIFFVPALIFVLTLRTRREGSGQSVPSQRPVRRAA